MEGRSNPLATTKLVYFLMLSSLSIREEYGKHAVPGMDRH